MNRIQGYRVLEEWEIDLMNVAKGFEAEMLEFIEAQFSTGSCDDRWLAIARTDLQKGFMALNRAIEKPGNLVPPPASIGRNLLTNVDIVHDDDGKVLAVKDPEDRDPENLAGEPCLGAEVRKLGLTGEGEGNY
ncbi:MAG: hypothetical protein J3T61_06645 [Candidatus Brocadiales bacterium]|nr:hypothetical protein [Candidatus Bathyanammoxibius sp.]